MTTYEAEAELEQLAVATGYRKALEAELAAEMEGDALGASRTSGIVSAAIPIVSATITRRIPEHGGSAVDAVLRAIGSRTLALIGLSRALGLTLATGEAAMVKVVRAIAGDVRQEAWAQAVRTGNKSLWDKVVARQKDSHANHALRVKGARRLIREADPTLADKAEARPWPLKKDAEAVSPILDGILATGLWVLGEIGDARMTSLALTDEAMEMLAARSVEGGAQFRHTLYPMVIQPLPWGKGLKGGGYLHEEIQTENPMVISHDRGRNARIERAVADGSAADAVEALNTLQSVPLRIHQETLGVVQQAAEERWKARKMPTDDYPDHAAPLDYDLLSEEAKKGARIRMREARALARSMQADFLVRNCHLDTAKLLGNYPAFWLPHKCDFRGRVYAIPAFNHQRADYVRGLFRFAEGTPLGAHGWHWLLVHLANVASGSLHGKLDKLSFADRFSWSYGNLELIRKVARQEDDWVPMVLGSDKPFSFFSACHEAYRIMEEVRKGASIGSVLSDLPVAQDGSNSGLQHYAAIMRSSTEGAMVNLLPTEKPADVYAYVAQKVVEGIHERLGILSNMENATPEVEIRDAAQVEADNEWCKIAHQWLAFGITRSTVKRPVMTVAYSSETYGFAEQTMADIMEPLSRKVMMGDLAEHPFGPDKGRKASFFLAKVIWQTLHGSLPGAMSALGWLKKTAELLARHDVPLMWNVPTGLPILQRYVEPDVVRVSLALSSQSAKVRAKASGEIPEEGALHRLRLNIATGTGGKMKPRKQAAAAGPNVVHSMDAAHLALTVLNFRRSGGGPILTIHDSFSATPGQSQLLADTLRSTFVDMYEGYCPLADIHARAARQLPEEARAELSEPPAKGDLDLSHVIRSPYFFA